MSDTMQGAQHRNRELLSAIKTAGEAALRLYAENDSLREQLAMAERKDDARVAVIHELHERANRAEARLAVAERKIAAIIGLCGQEGCDGEPYDTFYRVATGEFDPHVRYELTTDSASAPTPPPMDLSAAKEAARLHAQCPLCKSVNIVEMCDDCEHCWERGENMVADQSNEVMGGMVEGSIPSRSTTRGGLGDSKPTATEVAPLPGSTPGPSTFKLKEGAE